LSTGINYRYYKSGDEADIVSLLDEAFNGWPKLDVDPLGYWRWKYIDSPYWKNDISLAYDKEVLIGCKHSVYHLLKVGQDILECSLGSDLAVKKEYRGIGVSKEIRRMSTCKKIEIGYDLSYFVTANPFLIKSFRKDHREITLPSEVRVFVKVKDIERQLEEMEIKKPLSMKTAYHLANSTNRITGILRRDDSTYKGEVRRIEGFGGHFDDLWGRLSKYYNFIVKRDAQYLRWRYGDERKGKYMIWVTEEEGNLDGYCVAFLNYYNEEYPVAYLIDLFCSPYRHGVMSALLGEVNDVFMDSSCNIITALAVEGSMLAQSLRKIGFLNSRRKLELFFGRHGKMADDEKIKETILKSSPKEIHFCFGEIDSIPVDIPVRT
jgi:hypothetical protein